MPYLDAPRSGLRAGTAFKAREKRIRPPGLQVPNLAKELLDTVGALPSRALEHRTSSRQLLWTAASLSTRLLYVASVDRATNGACERLSATADAPEQALTLFCFRQEKEHIRRHREMLN